MGLLGGAKKAAGGLLDASKAARLKRAADQDFGEKTYYHGTNKDFDEFKPDSMFAENVDYANRFSGLRSNDGANVIPVKLRQGKQWDLIEYGEDVPYIHQKDQSYAALKEQGYDSLRRKDGAITVFDPKNIRSVNAALDAF
jgi:hypothetical protein